MSMTYSPPNPPMRLWCGNCDATLLPEWLFLLLVVCRPACDVHIRSYLGSSSLPLLSVASCRQARFYYLSHHTLETEWNHAVPCCHGKTTWAISAWFGSIRFSTYSHYVLKPYQTVLKWLRSLVCTGYQAHWLSNQTRLAQFGLLSL